MHKSRVNEIHEGQKGTNCQKWNLEANGIRMKKEKNVLPILRKSISYPLKNTRFRLLCGPRCVPRGVHAVLRTIVFIHTVVTIHAHTHDYEHICYSKTIEWLKSTIKVENVQAYIDPWGMQHPTRVHSLCQHTNMQTRICWNTSHLRRSLTYLLHILWLWPLGLLLSTALVASTAGSTSITLFTVNCDIYSKV